MIERIEKLFRRWGLIQPFTEDDVINAEIENQARDHENMIDRLHEAIGKRLSTNRKLRDSIKIAQKRTTSFEQFERYLVRRRDD
jgi:hypothetical protein